ncbi:hypothetical protein Purlil1_8017 [Purpureocillium lilacinum]|uniref:Uncharacterized protein n=1 Tax=Purpureocillium lilacinum TaxID=33203 RepID=A0ABR0BUI4_PURLI|nr:hypothetical protein Purlil1_8017 [Purpureocillium lilacinum]
MHLIRSPARSLLPAGVCRRRGGAVEVLSFHETVQRQRQRQHHHDGAGALACPSNRERGQVARRVVSVVGPPTSPRETLSNQRSPASPSSIAVAAHPLPSPSPPGARAAAEARCATSHRANQARRPVDGSLDRDTPSASAAAVQQVAAPSSMPNDGAHVASAATALGNRGGPPAVVAPASLVPASGLWGVEICHRGQPFLSRLLGSPVPAWTRRGRKMRDLGCASWRVGTWALSLAARHALSTATRRQIEWRLSSLPLASGQSEAEPSLRRVVPVDWLTASHCFPSWRFIPSPSAVSRWTLCQLCFETVRLDLHQANVTTHRKPPQRAWQ